MRTLTDQQTASLEAMIDSTCVSDVLNTLSIICNGKAEHLQLNWQDTPASKAWIRASRAIDKAEHTTRKLGLDWKQL